MFVWDGLATPSPPAATASCAYDLIGRGASAAPRIRPTTPTPSTASSTELLDRVRPAGPVHLVALAFGALITPASPTAARAGGELTYVAPDGFGVRMSPAVTAAAEPGARRRAARGRRRRRPAVPPGPATPNGPGSSRRCARGPSLATAPGFQRAVLSSVRRMPVHDAGALYRRSDDRGVPTLVLWGLPTASPRCPTPAPAPRPAPCRAAGLRRDGPPAHATARRGRHRPHRVPPGQRRGRCGSHT